MEFRSFHQALFPLDVVKLVTFFLLHFAETKRGGRHAKFIPSNFDPQWVIHDHSPAIQESYKASNPGFKQTCPKCNADLDSKNCGFSYFQILDVTVSPNTGFVLFGLPSWKSNNVSSKYTKAREIVLKPCGPGARVSGEQKQT